MKYISIGCPKSRNFNNRFFDIDFSFTKNWSLMQIAFDTIDVQVGLRRYFYQKRDTHNYNARLHFRNNSASTSC